MPKYEVIVTIGNDWHTIIEAPDEQEARDIAYRESEPDVGPHDHINIYSREITDAEV